MKSITFVETRTTPGTNAGNPAFQKDIPAVVTVTTVTQSYEDADYDALFAGTSSAAHLSAEQLGTQYTPTELEAALPIAFKTAQS